MKKIVAAGFIAGTSMLGLVMAAGPASASGAHESNIAPVADGY